MRFALLGPLALVRDTGERVAVGGARLRALLAVLLLHAGRPVSLDALAELVWDGVPPRNAAASLRGHVLRLRRLLGSDAKARLAHRDPGYLIHVEQRELDVFAFQASCDSSGAAIRDRDWRAASLRASEALALWQGSPLADVPSQALRDAWVPRLEQAQVQLLEWRVEAELHLGRGDQLIPGLRTLVGEHPLRERFHAQLMLALAGAGRQAEALAAYQDARRVMVDQLGIEPGPELRAVQERILDGDADLLSLLMLTPTAPPDPAEPATVLATPGARQPPHRRQPSRPAHVLAAPRQLPAAIVHFAGRTRELKALTELLDENAGAGGTVVIDGTAGVGKTALAVHWAHQVADRFPDGQLYVNLRGFDPSGTPAAPAAAMRRLLAALGVAAARIPADLEEQAALYRSHLAGRRVLVLLDNARDADQVRPLLPGEPGSLAVVTSRRQLGGLVALDGAVPLGLDLLSGSEARDLLLRRLGAERVTADERTVAKLIGLCARLPLALNITATRAALSGRSLSELVDELRDTRSRLDALTTGDEAADVRAVFSWSYHSLSREAARVFRFLGVHPGPDAGVPAVVSLTGLATAPARRALSELTRAHLLAEHAPGRYAFHDLLRAYAAERAHAEESEHDLHDALRRFCDSFTGPASAGPRAQAPTMSNPHPAPHSASSSPTAASSASSTASTASASPRCRGRRRGPSF